MEKKQPDDGKESSETINISGSQVGVAGKDVRVDGGIHYHYYQQSPAAAAPEKPKDSGNSGIQCKPVKVFISYAREDIDMARRLYADLKMAGIVPWMDKIDLLPGQNWKFHITKAIRESSYFIALLFSKSLSKRGFVQKELKLALDILGEFSDEDVFLIPVRLDDCYPEDEKLKYLQWADLFPSYEAGRDEIFRVFQHTASVSEPEREFTNSLGMKFVYIRPGTLMMGSPRDEPERSDDEILHKVTLTKGFYMQTTQVTVGHWRIFVRSAGFKTEAETGDGAYGWTGSEWKKDKRYYWDNPGFPQTDEHPVTCVSWNDAQAFIMWLNQKEGKIYRLPTEAEWEYSCRAGTAIPFFFGKCLSTDVANYDGNYPLKGCPKGKYREKTVPVGSFAPNAWGLYDMHGNVCEWCQDWYGEYSADAATDSVGVRPGLSVAAVGTARPGTAGLPTGTGTFPATGAATSVSGLFSPQVSSEQSV